MRKKLAKRFELALRFSPGLVIALAAWAAVEFIRAPGWAPALAFLGALYALPLLTYRLINLFAPLEEGVSQLSTPNGYVPWVGAHRIQVIYHIFPVLERVLRAFPGVFSLWLRLWGSKIGKHVYWLPEVEITDRTHLEIGNFVFVGNRCYLSPHVVKNKGDHFTLLFERIRIGDRVFIGAGTRMAPGVRIESGSEVPLLTDLLIRKRFPPREPATSSIEERAHA